MQHSHSSALGMVQQKASAQLNECLQPLIPSLKKQIKHDRLRSVKAQASEICKGKQKLLCPTFFFFSTRRYCGPTTKITGKVVWNLLWILLLLSIISGFLLLYNHSWAVEGNGHFNQASSALSPPAGGSLLNVQKQECKYISPTYSGILVQQPAHICVVLGFTNCRKSYSIHDLSGSGFKRNMRMAVWKSWQMNRWADTNSRERDESH